MKKSLAKKITLSILAGAVLMSSNVVWAATPAWVEVGVKAYAPIVDGNGTGTLDGPITGIGYYYGEYDSINGADGNNSKVTITDGSFLSYPYIYGGYSNNNSANSNEVNIVGGSFYQAANESFDPGRPDTFFEVVQ